MNMGYAALVRLAQLALGNIRKRHWVSGTIVLSTALVVVVLVGFLSMSEGFNKALANTGASDVALVMSQQARVELNSQLSREQVNLLRSGPGIVRRAEPLVSAETSVMVGAIQRVTEDKINVNLRGLEPNGPAIRDGFALVAGRMFQRGTNEIIVGQKLAREAQGFDLGHTIRLGGVDWRVVGIFRLTGYLFESEIWTDLASVQSAYQRDNQYQSVRIKLVAGDVRLDLNVQSEKDYFAKQSEGMVNLVAYLAWPLAILLSMGTFTGIYNAMHISVRARKRELIVMRQIGFSRMAVFASILFESLLCSLAGALLGGLLAFLLFDGVLTATVGNSFDSLSYALTVNGKVLTYAFLLSAAVGVLAVLVPATQAARYRLSI
jgi:putative ABC transport system permease protein